MAGKAGKISSFKRPVVGVLVGNRFVRTRGSLELAKANKRAQTTLNFFSTKDVDFYRGKITGRYFNHAKKSWERKSFPFPDVLYVRGGSGRRVRNIVEKFDDLGIKRINPIAGFNKGELIQKLSQDSDVRPFLPYTERLDDISEARDIIPKLGKVYMKACRGRRGTKVVRIAKLSKGGYEYKYSIIGKLVHKKVKDFDSLQKAMDAFFDGRSVIVQQAIDVVRVGRDRLVDFRAEVQRNKQGKIEIVAIPIRVGQKNSPITTHASAYRFDSYLKKLFPKYSKKKLAALKNRISRFLVTVYKAVEKCYGKFGEIGIDFAVDKKGKIWIIECNAQSAKVSIRKAYGSDTVRRAYLNPLEYAKTIAGSN